MNNQRGIPIEKLTTAYTDEKTVLAFFSKHPTLAFTVKMLVDEGFSTNIRKVLNRLVDNGLLEKKTVIEENHRWEAAYYLAELSSSFIIHKVDSTQNDEKGWKLVAIQNNALSLTMEFLHDEDSFWVNLKLPETVEAKFFIRNPEGALNAISFSEIQPALTKRSGNIVLEIDVDEAFDGEFDYFCDGSRKRETRSRSRIIGTNFTQYAGAIGFNFEIIPSKRHIAITAVAWDDDTDDERRVDMARVCFGDYDEAKGRFEEEREAVTHILISY